MKSDPLSTMTNAFSKLDPDEGAAVQFVLRPAASGWQKKLQKAAVKMKPLVEALRILRDETRNVDGVDIYFHGDTDCAIVKVENPKRTDRYRIEPSADCLLFEIEHLIDIGDRFPRINSFCNLSQDKVMDSIIELVGKHIGLLRACAEREVTYKLLVGR